MWTADQLAEFLGSVNDPLFAFYWLAGLRGLRRGELCGLRWSDIDLDRAVLTMRVHRRCQQDRPALTGCRSTRTTPPPGSGSSSAAPGLPPVRLHDLRHGAASLAHEADVDLKTLQDLLGHSSIVVTADTYTSVLPQTRRRCADATAQPVLNAARRTRKKIKTKARKNRPDRPNTGAPSSGETTVPPDGTHTTPTVRKRRKRRRARTASLQLRPCRSSAPEGTRTPNLLIRSQMLYPLSYGRLVLA